MKLTSKGRYAVMALVDLARFDNINPVSLRDISLRQGISLSFLEQIFLSLTSWLAPVLCYTSEEAWLSYKDNKDTSIHLEQFHIIKSITTKW